MVVFFLWAEIRPGALNDDYIYRRLLGVFRAILYQQLAYCPFFTQTLVNHAKSCPKGTILKGLISSFCQMHTYI